jgi:hypothetical protein
MGRQAMSYHKYSVGQLCVIVRSPYLPHLIGRQATILEPLWIINDYNPFHDYLIEVQGEPSRCTCTEDCLQPIKPGDLPDFALEEESLTEEEPA